MITMPDLQTALLDLLHEVQGTDIKLIVGGGFGIYLKTDHAQKWVLTRLSKNGIGMKRLAGG